MLICWAEFTKQWRWWHCLQGNKKPKKNQKKKKKGQNIINSGNVLGWTDFEALHLSVVMLYSVLVNSQCDLHHYENIVLKDSHNYMYNIKIITWPYIWINLTSARLWWRSFSFNKKVLWFVSWIWFHFIQL